MAIIKKKTITWDASPDPDVVAHHIYVEPADQELQQGISPHARVDMPTLAMVAPDEFPPDTFLEDMDYKIGISAIDDVGNESDMVILEHPFDFVAPAAPSNIQVSDA